MPTRRNLTQPDDWWKAFDEAAAAAGQPLSEWLGEAGKARLPKTTARKLSKRPPAHRPKQTKDKPNAN